ncbi:hypothetical protein FGG08_005635 [Glutinoglossum americanum]|uniref:DUF7708 domain-containing protein n=1 Tax=Glutinoglossum americanum TaxID=1670608 RepID=A0A9P8KVU2_9PEZI|nr:hypothetical protein FGG08_005635 [Glutinoglossum americanum]
MENERDAERRKSAVEKPMKAPSKQEIEPVPPAIRLTNPAAEFIDTRLDFGPAYANPKSEVKFDPQQDQFTTEPSAPVYSESLYDAATAEKEQFLAAMAEFEKTAKPSFKTNVNIRGKHSWEDVISEARKAETVYKQSSAVRRCFRTIGDAPALEAWLGLLPAASMPGGSSFVSIFCLGFQLILSAATRIGDLRELTFATLAQIPETIQSAQIYASEYSSPKLHQRNADLYVGVLSLLEHILAWYQQKATTKVFRAVTKPGNYERELGEKVTAVKGLAKLVKDELVFCGHVRLGRVDSGIRRIREKVNKMDDKIDEVLPVLQAAYSLFCSDLEQHRWQKVMLEAKLEEQAKLLEKYEERLSRSPSPTAAPQGTSRRKLLNLLPYSSRGPPADVLSTLHHGLILPLPVQDRAEHIMRSPYFKNWITTLDSKPLIINANEGSPLEVFSCISFVSAMLVRTLQEVGGNVMVGSHFCALHRRGKEGHLGPAGMLVSLIGQLLGAYANFDFSFFHRSQKPSLLSNSIKPLATLLATLIRQLPPKTAYFCIIDSVSCYENADQRRDTCKAVQALVELTEHPTDAVVKVLITSPGRCGYVHDMVEVGDVFDVPEFIDGGRMGFRGGVWDEAVGGDLGELEKRMEEELGDSEEEDE